MAASQNARVLYNQMIVAANHIGIIMDGNRRWAKAQGLPIEKGHEQGALNIESLVEKAAKLSVKALTFYAFSTENWTRNPLEVQQILSVFRKMLVDPVTERLIEKGVRVNMIGNYKKFPGDIVESIEKIHASSMKNDRIIVHFALNYGGRDEIVRAVNHLVESNKKITSESVSESLDTAGVADPDLIIRTGGEQRLSNFLTWQSVYSELYFTDVLWPDFKVEQLEEALDWFEKRQRRFGK